MVEKYPFPMLLHTQKKHNDKKKPNRALYPAAWATVASFSDFWPVFPEFFKTQKIVIFCFEKIGPLKKSRFP